MPKQYGLVYRPDIDGLRAIAIISVVLFHAFPNFLKGGFIGVDVFFVISGFFISNLIFKGIDQNSFSIKEFYSRRMRRILPALLLVLSACIIMGWSVFLPNEYKVLGKHVLGATGFFSNFQLWEEANYFDLSSNYKPLLHLWSLAIEEQFYLLWPLILLVASRLSFNIFYLIVSVFLVSFIINVVAVETHPTAIFYLPFSRAWELVMGAILALFYEKKPLDALMRQLKWNTSPNAIPLISASNLKSSVGLLFIFISTILLNKNEKFPGWWGLLPTLGAFLIIWGGPQAWVNRHILARKPFVFIGLISYPLYLWHWPLLSFSRIEHGDIALSSIHSIVLILLSILFSWLTYAFIEKRLRFQKHPAVLCGLIFTLFFLGYLGYSIYKHNGFANRNELKLVENILKTAEGWGTYEEGKNLRRFNFLGKSFFEENSNLKEKVLFIGDSNMEQYWPRIDELIKRHPNQTKSAVFFTAQLCPPIPNTRSNDSLTETTRCVDLINNALKYAEQPEISTVVIAAQWLVYFFDNSRHFWIIENGKRYFFNTHIGMEKAYQSIDSVLHQLKAAGKKVYIILNIPKGYNMDPKHMVKRRIFHLNTLNIDPIDKKEMFSKSDYVKIRDHLRKLAEKSGAIAIDPVDYLCKETSCPVLYEGNKPIYSNGWHIAKSYVRKYATFIDQTITCVADSK